jgi:hypothetical protein
MGRRNRRTSGSRSISNGVKTTRSEAGYRRARCARLPPIRAPGTARRAPNDTGEASDTRIPVIRAAASSNSGLMTLPNATGALFGMQRASPITRITAVRARRATATFGLPPSETACRTLEYVRSCEGDGGSCQRSPQP